MALVLNCEDKYFGSQKLFLIGGFLQQKGWLFYLIFWQDAVAHIELVQFRQMHLCIFSCFCPSPRASKISNARDTRERKLWQSHIFFRSEIFLWYSLISYTESTEKGFESQPKQQFFLFSTNKMKPEFFSNIKIESVSRVIEPSWRRRLLSFLACLLLNYTICLHLGS